MDDNDSDKTFCEELEFPVDKTESVNEYTVPNKTFESFASQNFKLITPAVSDDSNMSQTESNPPSTWSSQIQSSKNYINRPLTRFFLRQLGKSTKPSETNKIHKTFSNRAKGKKYKNDDTDDKLVDINEAISLLIQCKTTFLQRANERREAKKLSSQNGTGFGSSSARHPFITKEEEQYHMSVLNELAARYKGMFLKDPIDSDDD